MAPNPVKVPGSGNGGNHVGRELDAATMGMTDDQIKHLPTLERTMVKTFGVFVTVSMVLIAIILIVSIVLTGNATENISEDGLEDQINDHLKSSAIELSEKVNLRFKAIEESVVNFTVSIHGQAAEDDSSDILEYQEYKDFASDEDGENSICHELDGSVQVERLRGTDIETAATLNYSVWAIPEGEDDNDPQVEQDREDSFTMQYFYRNLWRNNIPLIALYTGYAESNLWRYYPGVCDLDPDPPDARPWYEPAEEDIDSIHHIGPYEDAFGIGLLITISRAVHKGGLKEDQGDFIGVTGADITIDQLRQEILRVQFFGEEAASMARFGDGRVVEDPFWDGESADDASDEVVTPKIHDIRGGGFTESFWEDLREKSQGAKILTYEREDGEKYIVARSFVPPHPDDAIADESMDEWEPRYVVFVEAPEKEVLKPLSDLSDEISESRRDLIIIATFLSLGVCLIVLGLIKVVAKRITGPLRRMMDTAKTITDQAAKDEEMVGELDTDIPEPNDEIGEFVREFKQMVHGMNKGGVKGSKVHQFVSNPFYSEGSAHPDVPWNDVLRDIGRRQ